MVDYLISLITTEIASVQKYQTRLALLQKYYSPRMKTCLVQLSLKHIGLKIWSNIPENLKSFSPYSFGKQCKNVLLSCQNSCWFSFCMLVIFCNIVLMPQSASYHLGLQLLTPPLVHRHAFHTLFLSCFFAYFTSMHFVTFLLLAKRLQWKIALC